MALVFNLLILHNSFAHHLFLMFSEVYEGNHGKYWLAGSVIRLWRCRK